ncbi:MAG: hypothetical protein NTY67_15320 [Cyanobacteria bacterium]|nr:hypothetical protein [Cyanobacteriota bacterium]
MFKSPGFLILASGSAQASSSLALASTAWLLSGLNPSPLLNVLLPVLATVPLLLPLPQRLRLGYVIQISALLLLLAVATPWAGRQVLWPLAGVFLLVLGQQIGQSPLENQLQNSQAIPAAALRTSAEGGRLIGHLLTGLLFPLGKALLQFSQALVLLLPLAPAMLGLAAVQPQPQATVAAEPEMPGSAALYLPSLLQGMLFGSLFALLPLWVRQEGAGNCFDFGMVITAYSLGRSAAAALASRWRLATPLPYLLLAVLLAATQMLPGWGAVGLFVPFGLLAGLSDGNLGRSAPQPPDGRRRSKWLERSGSVGGLAGSLLMGLLAQVTALGVALPLQLVAFVAAALVLPRLAATGNPNR